MAGDLEELAGRSVEFKVWARDGGVPPRDCVTPATITVAVRNMNMAPAAFSETLFTATLYTPTVAGVRVLCPAAAAHEEAMNNQPQQKDVQYTISQGDDHKKFELERETFCIIVRDHLDLKNLYNLTLEAMTNDGGLATSRATVEITVESWPPQALLFTQNEYQATVLENSTKEVNVVAVVVKGEPLNHHVHYSVLNPSDKFLIHPTAGVIKTTGKPFDRETQDQYTLLVQVSSRENSLFIARACESTGLVVNCVDV